MQGVWGGHGGRYAPRGRIRHQRRREAHKPREDGRPGPGQNPHAIRLGSGKGSQTAMRERQGRGAESATVADMSDPAPAAIEDGACRGFDQIRARPHPPPPRPLAAEPVDATGRASYSWRFPLAGGRAVPNRLRRLAP